MRQNNIQNIARLRETTPHGNSLFPFMLYDNPQDTSFEERIGCHWHEEVELLVITGGEAALYQNGESYSVRENSICLIPSNRLHLLTCPVGQRLDFFAIVFHPDFLYSLNRDTIQKKYLEPLLSGQVPCRILHPSEEWEKQLLQCLLHIRTVFHAKEYAYELLIKACLLKAFYLLVSHTTSAKSYSENTSDHHIVLVKSMMEYLRRHYDCDIALTQLESEFNLSRGHICRLFKSMTHMTPFEYLNYYRIQQSVDFLERSDDNISVIATRVGFNNVSYYNRTFRRYMHMTPSQFRAGLS